ncbi:MAG: hypothetical protein KDI90_08235 [Alphaproteobacteria bacterium]|nr:hypothetical protein [Alphaproteobacteria bacterium]MCB9975358.1 hypothetical protein [Rhodospirillales bacterium]
MNDDGSTSSRLSKMNGLFRAEYLLPTIIKGALNGQIALNPEAEHSIHTVISEMEPDIALLCCAHIAQEIYKFEKARELDLAFLGKLSEKIIKEFRPLCALSQTAPDLRAAKLKAALPRLADQMEKFMDNLDLTRVALEIYDTEAAAILDILRIQLQGQFLIVDQLIEIQETGYMYEDEENIAERGMLSIMAGIGIGEDSNIIPFPLKP